MKLVNINAHDTEDLVPRLERILDLAKEGRVTDFASVYFQDGEPSYAVSYRSANRVKMLGMAVVLQKFFTDLILIE